MLKYIVTNALNFMIHQEMANVTILIFSFERHNQLLRAIKFYSAYGLKICVLDGSQVPLDESAIAYYPSLDYYSFRNESYVSRMSRVFGKLHTSYTCLVADDDYILPSGILASILLLDSMGGRSKCSGGIPFKLNYLNKDISINVWNHWSFPISRQCIDSDARANARFLCNVIASVQTALYVYLVYDTNYLFSLFSAHLAFAQHIARPEMFESFTAGMNIVRGNALLHDEPFMLRGFTESNHTGLTDIDESHHPDPRIPSFRKGLGLERLVRFLARYLTLGGCENIEAIRFIKIYFEQQLWNEAFLWGDGGECSLPALFPQFYAEHGRSLLPVLENLNLSSKFCNDPQFTDNEISLLSRMISSPI